MAGLPVSRVLPARDEGIEQRLIDRRRQRRRVGHDVLQRSACSLPARLAAQARIDLEPGAGGRMVTRDFRKPGFLGLDFAESSRSASARRPSMRTGMTRRVGLVRNHRGAVVDLHQAAGDRQAAFRKDDERRAVLHSLDQVAHAEGTRWIDGEDFASFRNGFTHHALAIVVSTAKAACDGSKACISRRIEQAYMIGRYDGFLSRLRKVFETFDLEVEKDLEQECGDVPDSSAPQARSTSATTMRFASPRAA